MLIPVTTSAEVHWFCEGPIPENLMIWFKRSKLMFEDSKHDHLYLAFNHATPVGFALREGSLDVESLQKSSDLHRFTERTHARIHLWLKWSHEASKLDEDVRALFENDRWVKVRTQRRLRKFSLDQGTLSEVRGNDSSPQTACHIELTNVELGARKFWSLGFESFGHANQVEETLRTVSAYCFSERDSPLKRSLNGAQSLPYPEWILSVRPRPSQPSSNRDGGEISTGTRLVGNARRQLNEIRSELLEDLPHKYDRSLSKEELGAIIGRKI
ncbi:MAG: hypothetical protein H8K04_10480 [Nitrospira sp.]